MVKEAFFRANIPFTINKTTNFETNLVDNPEENGWKKSEIQGSFLLKHINTSINKNVVCYSKECQSSNFSIPMGNSNYTFAISEVYVFCFDTGVGIVSFHIPYDNNTCEENIINTCCALRSSAEHPDHSNGVAIIRNGAETYLSRLADEHLKTFFAVPYSLFNHFNDNSFRRVDMFSAVLCEKNEDGTDTREFDKLCYLLANTFDNRDPNPTIEEQHFYNPHDYTRWCFSKRGCCVVANLTGTPQNDSFLNSRWFGSVKSNYFYLYLMVLHQKYAIYKYLNTIASDAEKINVKFNQELLIDFNSKYMFSIVSDEPMIQNTYLRMKDINNVNEVYCDLQDEQKRLFDYSQLKNDESNEVRNNRLNLISVVISVLCSITIVFDSINMLSTHGYYMGFDSSKEILCTAIISFEIMLFIGCLLYIFIISKRKK